MKLRTIRFQGHYEEEPRDLHEELNILEPEGDEDVQFLWWALMPHAETVTDDVARRDYVIQYELLRPRGRGLYDLRVTCRDASGKPWVGEIVAAMVVTIGAAEQGRSIGFAPHWFISKDLHFKSDEEYPGPSFGRLTFGDSTTLPHRRLFGATVS